MKIVLLSLHIAHIVHETPADPQLHMWSQKAFTCVVAGVVGVVPCTMYVYVCVCVCVCVCVEGGRSS